MNISWIDSNSDLSVLLDEMAGCSRYAMDTEFHRERTYFPQLALIQIKHNNKIFLIDPTSVELQLFTDLFEDDDKHPLSPYQITEKDMSPFQQKLFIDLFTDLFNE